MKHLACFTHSTRINNTFFSIVFNIVNVLFKKIKFKDNDLVSFKQLKMFSRQVFVIPTFGSSVNFIFVLFQLHGKRGVKVDIISYHL